MTQKDVDKLFRYEHLPPHLAQHSAHFHAMAMFILDSTSPSAEQTLAIQKLWEVKNLAVYALVAEGDQA